MMASFTPTTGLRLIVLLMLPSASESIWMNVLSVLVHTSLAFAVSVTCPDAHCPSNVSNIRDAGIAAITEHFYLSP